MTRLRIVLCFAAVCLTSSGVSLGAIVPNPGFETYTSLPSQHSQIAFVPPWYSPTAASPDYYHALGTGTGTVLGNIWGSQTPYEGDAFTAVISYNSLTEEREYIQAPLNSPLVANQQYTVTFYVSLADDSGYAVDGMGALFTNGTIGHAGYTPINATPQVANPTSNVLSNDTGWVPISGSFIAAGGENYITIGNFLNDANVTLATSTGGSVGAIYYVDGISVTGHEVPEPATWMLAAISTAWATFVVRRRQHRWKNG